jgi:hypothetical protein
MTPSKPVLPSSSATPAGSAPGGKGVVELAYFHVMLLFHTTIDASRLRGARLRVRALGVRHLYQLRRRQAAADAGSRPGLDATPARLLSSPPPFWRLSHGELSSTQSHQHAFF